ncbi:MAG: patatin-like phospholipase family protein, partial [Bacteroidales bacterium]|nr:patatin-like phospholipase family protein [Bacteroidales bacterium]
MTVVLLLAAPLRAGAQLATSSVNPQDDTLAVRQMRTFLNGIRRSEKRPTVALVLSGGGAKGAAHVGVLKYLEENKIPIDVVIGTSMGGLMGGLYSMGYSATELDSLLTTLDWGKILSDDVPKDYISYKNKRYREVYSLRLPFHYLKRDLERRLEDDSPDKVLERSLGLSKDQMESVLGNSGMGIGSSLPAGFVAGLNVTNQISSLSVGYQDDIPFSDFPRPFFCVASDLVSCKAYNWSRGSIVDAMRSTMSIPGLFDPVRYQGKVLIDGGTRNNFPTDIARAMGADIIIGVELSDPDKTYTEINNLGNLLMPLIDMLG